MHSKDCTGIGNLRMKASHNILVLLADVVGEHLDTKNTAVGMRIAMSAKKNSEFDNCQSTVGAHDFYRWIFCLLRQLFWILFE